MSGLDEYDRLQKMMRQRLLDHLRIYGYLSTGHYHYGMWPPMKRLVEEGLIIESGRDEIRGGTVYKPTKKWETEYGSERSHSTIV